MTTAVRNRSRESIRQLRPGEVVPAAIPRRYLTGHGYVRLRWKIATATYVETLEHRIFDGAVTTAEHVHHINGIKTDNRPENLERMSSAEHNSHHSSLQGRKWAPFRSFDAMWKAAHAENRRCDIAKRTEDMRDWAQQGFTTIQIGQVFGLHPSAVSRYLTKGRNW